jgi:hypothetical protein
MKVVFVDEKDDSFSWEVVRYPFTFNEWVKHLKEYKPYITKIFVYDVQICKRFLCDQGCEMGYGCFKEYREDIHSLKVIYKQVFKKKDKKKYFAELRAKEE